MVEPVSDAYSHYQRLVDMFERTRAAQAAATPDEWLLAWFDAGMHTWGTHRRKMFQVMWAPNHDHCSNAARWPTGLDDSLRHVYDTDGNEIK